MLITLVFPLLKFFLVKLLFSLKENQCAVHSWMLVEPIAHILYIAIDQNDMVNGLCESHPNKPFKLAVHFSMLKN